MISLAEGMPNEEVFPFSRLEMQLRGGGSLQLEGREMAAALQYLPSQGLPSLLSELRQFQQDLHRPPPADRDIIVTNGSQHAIYQCAELLLDPGDAVISTQFAYTGLHSVLKPYDSDMIFIPEDDNGLVPELLDQALSERAKKGLRPAKMLYIIPTGTNPTGVVLPEERRRHIYELACKYDFLIIEDDPYMFLDYSEKFEPSFLSLDSCGRVLRLDSLSKVVSAGLRVGWVSAPTPLLQRLELHMQAELLHTCTLAQVIALHLVSDRAALAAHLQAAHVLYRRRRDALHTALQVVGDLIHYTVPRAGLFLWCRVNGVEDVYNMVFNTAFNRGLMLVPGHAFMSDTSVPCQYLRLTFSRIRFEDMDQAARYLAEIIKDEQALQKQPRRLATER